MLKDVKPNILKEDRIFVERGKEWAKEIKIKIEIYFGY